jgi:hypothetical protein
MSSQDYLRKAELMLEQPQNYSLDEFTDVIVEVGMQDKQLAEELEDVFVKQMQIRHEDPNEEYELDDDFKQLA